MFFPRFFLFVFCLFVCFSFNIQGLTSWCCRLDASLVDFFDSIQNWPEVFEFLAKKFVNTSRDIRGNADLQGRGERHLILFNGNHQDLLVHFKYAPIKEKGDLKVCCLFVCVWPSSLIVVYLVTQLELFVIRREVLRTTADQQTEIEQLEFQQINELVTSISYFLWAKLLKKE